MVIRRGIIRRSPTGRSIDPARGRETSLGDGDQVFLATVGHDDETPQFVRIEQGQPWVEIRIRPQGDEIMARVAVPAAGNGSGWHPTLSSGCRVLVVAPGGDLDEAVIVGQMWDDNCRMPDDVAGVSTGAVGKTGTASGPAAMWQFIRTPDGQLLAIETGTNGDVLIHAGASVQIKSGGQGAIHLDGSCHLGVSPVSGPTGATTGPDGSQVEGTPATAHVPTPHSAPAPVPPDGINPYTGPAQDAIVRAKELYQSHAGIDPNFWAKLTAIATNPLIAVGPILSMTSAVSSAGGNTGSKHTASD